MQSEHNGVLGIVPRELPMLPCADYAKMKSGAMLLGARGPFPLPESSLTKRQSRLVAPFGVYPSVASCPLSITRSAAMVYFCSGPPCTQRIAVRCSHSQVKLTRLVCQ